MQRHQSGQHELRSRHPQLTFLRIHEGPRFGLVAAYTADLKVLDREDPKLTYHWLTRFTPIDHDGAAWLVFDVTPAAFERLIAAGDRRAACDLAVAWLRERDFGHARAALAMLPAGTADEPNARGVRELIDLMEAVQKGDEAQRNTAIERLGSAGHPDLALSLLINPQRGDAIRVFILTWAAGRCAEAVDTLEQTGADGSRTLEEVYLLATALHGGGPGFLADPVRAQKVMERGPAPAPGSQLEQPWQELRQKVRRAALWFGQVAK
jgi:HEAT repeat protein